MTELEEADDLEGPDWTDNHRLNTWLAERRAAFPAWGRETSGGTAEWDFSPESLDRLEDLVRGVFRTYEEISAAQDEPFLVGAAWYFGEVQVRQCGAVWRWCPQPSEEPDNPYDVPMVQGPERVPDEDEDEYDDCWEDDDHLHVCNPMSTLCGLYLRAPNEEERLRDALKAYTWPAHAARRVNSVWSSSRPGLQTESAIAILA
ncbi:hypothetical protein [Streptomyces halobius]|uniref:SUKH-4 immunity protein of toxin-antitoxin system n=1 Tax=Streptomyces halobius TaxID=2879846 RepID=A0ABY4MH65_9ACTN|nr:hypothetical protein [Streptomyces halobius]UQA97047.1 hypothetical protein K9S39_38875 [Streptomyces halobius]